MIYRVCIGIATAAFLTGCMTPSQLTYIKEKEIEAERAIALAPIIEAEGVQASKVAIRDPHKGITPAPDAFGKAMDVTKDALFIGGAAYAVKKANGGNHTTNNIVNNGTATE